MSDRDLPPSHPGAVDYDGTPQRPGQSAVERDLPRTHPYAVDNPRRVDAFEKCDLWRLSCQPKSLLPEGFTAPPPPGQPASLLADAQPEEPAENPPAPGTARVATRRRTAGLPAENPAS
jgi:hypothetical protein